LPDLRNSDSDVIASTIARIVNGGHGDNRSSRGDLVGDLMLAAFSVLCC
jgi:hypothetical protein